MTEYEYQCPKCHRVFTVLRDPHKSKPNKLWAWCKCHARAKRMFAEVRFRVAEPNGPDGFNLGLGKHFKSIRDRDYFADSQNLRLVKDG